MDEPHAAVAEHAVTIVERPRRIVVGAAGSIAACKAPFVVRLLCQARHEVKVVATELVLRFIGAPALTAVSGRPVSTGAFDDPTAIKHMTAAGWAKFVVVTPAPVGLLAWIRAGRTDNMLTATILACQAPVVLAPAMYTQIWVNPATRENVAALRERGLAIIEPDNGHLTGKDPGMGRVPGPEQIVSQSLATLTCAAAGFAGTQGASGEGDKSLQGRHVVVSAGGTREPIDPVKYLGNRSSGRQGCAPAATAAEQGIRVTLIQTYVASDLLKTLPAQVSVVITGTTADMLRVVCDTARGADTVVVAAAVADYRPITVATAKLKKRAPASGEPLSKLTMFIEFTINPDILAGLVSDPPRPGQIVVGFTAETGDENGDVFFHGRAKARRKGAHLLTVSAVGEKLGFGDIPNAVVVLDTHGTEVARGQGSKMDVARLLISLTTDLVNGA